MVLKLSLFALYHSNQFENDVKTYGTQTDAFQQIAELGFENDVKTYGTQTVAQIVIFTI